MKKALDYVSDYQLESACKDAKYIYGCVRVCVCV